MKFWANTLLVLGTLVVSTRGEVLEELFGEEADGRKCRNGMVFSTCATRCPKICGKPAAEVCNTACRVGCECPKDTPWYSRTLKACVKEDECNKPVIVIPPPKVKTYSCPVGQVWNECGSSCPKICGEKPSSFCTEVCVPKCECPEGLWLDKGTGKCMEQKECPKCPYGQEWKECGSECEELTCGQQKPEVCTKVCKPGCYCPQEKPWFHPKFKTCVSKRKCGTKSDPSPVPPSTPVQSYKCHSNLEWSECASACGPKVCGQDPVMCILACKPGCKCPDELPYYDAKSGKCVNKLQCQPYTCPEGTLGANRCLKVCGEKDCLPGCKCVGRGRFYDPYRQRCTNKCTEALGALSA